VRKPARPTIARRVLPRLLGRAADSDAWPTCAARAGAQVCPDWPRPQCRRPRRRCPYPGGGVCSAGREAPGSCSFRRSARWSPPRSAPSRVRRCRSPSISGRPRWKCCSCRRANRRSW